MAQLGGMVGAFRQAMSFFLILFIYLKETIKHNVAAWIG
jgi:hypothetical protein